MQCVCVYVCVEFFIIWEAEALRDSLSPSPVFLTLLPKHCTHKMKNTNSFVHKKNWFPLSAFNSLSPVTLMDVRDRFFLSPSPPSLSSPLEFCRFYPFSSFFTSPLLFIASI